MRNSGCAHHARHRNDMSEQLARAPCRIVIAQHACARGGSDATTLRLRHVDENVHHVTRAPRYHELGAVTEDLLYCRGIVGNDDAARRRGREHLRGHLWFSCIQCEALIAVIAALRARVQFADTLDVRRRFNVAVMYSSHNEAASGPASCYIVQVMP